MLKTLPALAALAAAATLVVPTVSQAQETNSVRVSYADLNLASQFGQNKLQHRIAYAAEIVCDKADPFDLNYTRAVSDCRIGAVAGAQPALMAAINAAKHPSVTVLDATALIVTRP
jgi:UrcA family protein